jgi:hypothetical protein
VLTSVSLPHGDNAGLVIAQRVGYYNQPSGEQAQSDEPFFSIVETIILESDARPGKHLFGVSEMQAVFCEVTVVLRLVPLVSQP